MGASPTVHPCPSTLPADMMRFLLKHVGELGPAAGQSLEQLGMLTGGGVPA